MSDLANVAIERCQCGEHWLPSFTPWVAYARAVHTAKRCGPCLMVGIDEDWRSPHAKLGVVWPEEAVRV